MVRQTRAARLQVEALLDSYIEKQRYDAAQKLLDAVAAAGRMIEADPDGGLPHPRPYPSIARWGYRWIKVHRY
jgi:plasmid stabilization system protein ParE